jgi:hypothetical protein
MPNNHNVTKETKPTETIYDLIDDLVDGPSCEMQCWQSFANASKATLSFENFLSLPHLPTRKKKKKKH